MPTANQKISARDIHTETVSILVRGQSELLNRGIAAMLQRKQRVDTLDFHVIVAGEKNDDLSGNIASDGTFPVSLVVLSPGDDLQHFRQDLSLIRSKPTHTGDTGTALVVDIADTTSFKALKPGLIIAGKETEIEVFFGARDERETLIGGVLAALRGNAFCSPSVFPHLLRALREPVIEHLDIAADQEMPPEHSPPVDQPLTWREREIAMLIASEGMSNDEIALRLHLSLNTIKTHVRHILRKLGIVRRTGIASALDTPLPPSGKDLNS